MQKPNLEKILSPHNILEMYLNSQSDYNDIEEACKKHAKNVWNAALDWAADNATIIYERKISDLPGGRDYTITVVDKQSILKGKL